MHVLKKGESEKAGVKQKRINSSSSKSSMVKLIRLNLRVNKYTCDVLGAIKEKYGLSNNSQSVEKFVELCGKEFLEN